jgi:hypothetical protein
MDKWGWIVPAAFVFLVVFVPLAYYAIRGANDEES